MGTEKTEIRKATEKDLQTIQELAHDFFKGEVSKDTVLNIQWPYSPEGLGHFQTMITGDDCICLVADVNGKSIGYLTGKVTEPTTAHLEKRAELENIFVQEACRDEHIGTALAEKFIAWTKSKGAKSILVITYPTSEKTVNFYKKLGFSPYLLTLKATVQ